MSMFSIKKNVTKKNGFTLVELLAIIAILSIIVTIVVYSVRGIFDNSKKKSFQTTINNIQTTAGDYVLENFDKINWKDGEDGDYQYQCITVQNLIDSGYFKNDILESMVDENTYVSASNSIYIEREKVSKNITKKIYLGGSETDYHDFCDSGGGDSSMDFYLITLDNMDAVEPGTDQIYGKYDVGIYLDDLYTKKMTVNENKIVVPEKDEYTFGGYYYYYSNASTSEGGVQLIDSSGYITADFTDVIFESDVTLLAKWIDDVSPTCTLTVTMEDGVVFKEVFDNIGVVSQNITKAVATDESTAGEVAGEITEGITYGYVEDDAGNVGVCSIDIQSSAKYNTVNCSSDNYSNPQSACTENYSSNNCKVSNTYRYTAKKCICRYDESDRIYRWREAIWLEESGLTQCSAIVSDYSACSWDLDGSNQTCGCSQYIIGSVYSGQITCYSNSCAEGYNKLESSNYCYKLG